ncbi:MAG: hypothetical protein U0T32_01185 [Chitinophagales bacterium]
MGRPISTDEYFEGATCVFTEWALFIFTSCGRRMPLVIAISTTLKRAAGGWDRPKNLEVVNCPGGIFNPVCL